ncbi:hypothetical protein PAEPH01_0079 [Pancytospora epiphaga]|nr:hypothetical protein PAEPH01_0079 [Pancytospora epiphaga]
MVFIKRHHLGNAAFYQLLTPYKNILLDYHSILFGLRHRYPSFIFPPKPLSFLLKKVQNIESVFITSSRSIGCLFLKPGVKIYCTKPVYDQILLAYFSYKRISVTYDEPIVADIIPEGDTAEQYEIFTIDDISIETFNNNVILIKYGQPILLNTTKIMALSAGTSIGWANYHILFPDKTILLYITSYSHRRRFSAVASPIDSTYLILNRRLVDERNEISQFSAFLEECKLENRSNPEIDKTIVIPISIQTIFVEIFFHALSVLEHGRLPVYVISPVFRRLELLINLQSEWLNKDFFTVAEPFPMSEYKNLTVLDDFSNQFKKGTKLVFCDFIEYRLFEGAKLFDNQTEVVVGDGREFFTNELSEYNFCKGSEEYFEIRKFNIKMESTDSEIIEGYKGIVLNKDCCFISTEPEYKVMLVDGDAIVLKDTLFISGILSHTDFENGTVQELSIKDDSCWLKRLVESNRCSVVNEWIVIIEKRIKFRYLNKHQIEYKYY